VGGSDLSLDEYKTILGTIGEKLSPDAKIIGGAQISEDMGNSIRVLLIATGVKSPQLLGGGESLESLKHREIEEELELIFLNNLKTLYF
jgi:cell division protein FtsZ